MFRKSTLQLESTHWITFSCVFLFHSTSVFVPLPDAESIFVFETNQNNTSNSNKKYCGHLTQKQVKKNYPLRFISKNNSKGLQ